MGAYPKTETTELLATSIYKEIFLKILLPLLSLALITGCATTGMNSSTGVGVYTAGLREGITATAHKPGTKTGMACATNILGLYVTGDATISEAAKLAGITNIATVEREFTNYVFFYGKMCTIVTGN